MTSPRGAAAPGIAAFGAFAACFLWAAFACAQEAPSIAPLADVAAAADTDGFRALRARAGGYYSYDNPWSNAGVIAQSTRYTQGSFALDVPGVLGLYRDQRRETLAGIDVEAGVVRVSGHLRPVGDANWRFVPSPGTAVELIAAADLVDTAPALESGIGYTFLALNLDKELHERFTVTGLAGRQDFSDGNTRNHARARLIWLALPDEGVSLQLRYRFYSSSEADVDGAYYNPARYQQWLGVAAFRKRHEGWLLSGALGAGRQRASGTGSLPSYLAEARAEGTVTGDTRLVLRAGYSRSAGYVESPDYAYWYAGATLVIPSR
jgi:hypothetical protein